MPNNQYVVVIDSHGYPDHIMPWIFEEDINSLQPKQISYIVLLSCNCGHYDYRTENVARMFAEKFHCTVIACDGDVQTIVVSGGQRFYKPLNNDTWNEYCRAKYSGRAGHACYGWLAYVPKSSANGYQGKLYQIAPYGGRMTLYDMLMNYYRGNVRELPAR